MKKLLQLWFGVSRHVTRGVYAGTGFGLMIFKYAVEAAVIWLFTGNVFRPWQFLNPALDARTALLRPAPEWVPWALFLWTLPFLWISVTMSVRRAANAGKSPWTGLFVLVPIINLGFMLAMCLAPSQTGASWLADERQPSDVDRVQSAAMAVGLSQMIGGLMLWLSVYVFSTYGASLFLGTPLLMGTTAAYLYNRRQPRSYPSSMLVGLLSVLFAFCALLLFAFEGVLCVAMAAPLLLPIGALGGLIGKAIAETTERPQGGWAAAILVLPLWAGGESLWMKSQEFMVCTAVEINAPAAVVWNDVISFPELPAERSWYFSCGIACPERARIVGQGIGAIRYCEFTTGAFTEPITTWQPPQRLAFDVTEQPDALVELSPYRNIRPPHLHGYLRSTHGEFRLVELAEGRIRLEGRTWYKFDMFPQWYWTVWSDSLMHGIHERVLSHIKRQAEEQNRR